MLEPGVNISCSDRFIDGSAHIYLLKPEDGELVIINFHAAMKESTVSVRCSLRCMYIILDHGSCTY